MDKSFIEKVNVLADRAGIKGAFFLEPLKGGANNRVYKLDAGSKSYLLKSYFRSADDKRDRLGAEYSFISFCRENGIEYVPEPFAADSENAMALYEFIEGDIPLCAEGKYIFKALDFFIKINQFRNSEPAGKLPVASEACFSVDAHFECVKRRLEKLCGIDRSTSPEADALDFVESKLLPAFGLAEKSMRDSDLDAGRDLVRDDRRISPSDFGFHNAIVGKDGHIRFIDFEYAGWDDPAKAVCDFFSQPRIPVPEAFVPDFIDALEEFSGEEFRERIKLLFPLYRIKWCCIMLNEFLVSEMSRRSYADENITPEKRKRAQLEKTLQYFDEKVKFAEV